MWRFIAAWLGLHPDLPFAHEVQHPVHGQEARNRRMQKVIYDQKQVNSKTGKLGKWVAPQNFSDRKPVTVTKG
jgi:hypothetical protein